MLILLKVKCGSAMSFDLSSDPDRLYKSMMKESLWDEEEQKITLHLSGFDSLCHKKFFNAIQKALKLKGSREMPPKFQLKSNNLKFPFSRNKNEYSAIKIEGESMSIKLLELSISGDSVMIFVGFILQSIIKAFLTSIEKVNKNTFDWTEDLPKPFEEVKEVTETLAESVEYEDFIEGNGKNVVIEDCTDDDDDYPGFDLDNKSEHSFSKSLDGDRKSHKRSVPDDMSNTPKKVVKKDSKEKELQIVDKCYICALLEISENVDDLIKAEEWNSSMECTLKCISDEDCLESLAKCISNIVIDTRIDENLMENMKKNIASIFVDILDNSPYQRGDLFCKMMEYLSDVPAPYQHRVVNLIRELCEIFVGNDPKSFEETLKRSKESRRNILIFLVNNGKFFSLQSVLEIWDILRRKRIHLVRILPLSMKSSIQQLDSAPDLKSSNYFSFMADITRKLITDVLKTKNVYYTKAKKIEFKIGSMVQEKSFDFYLYFNIVDKTLSHFLWDGSVVCEEIKFSKLKFEEKSMLLSTKYWDFLLPDLLNFDLKSILAQDESCAGANTSWTEEIISTKETIESPEIRDEPRIKKNPVDDIQNDIELGSPKMHMKGKSLKDIYSDDKVVGTFGNNENKEDVIKTNFIVEKKQVLGYWLPDKRKFSRPLAGRDWPKAYRCPCPVIFTYSHAKIVDSSKRITHFAKLRGSCKICKSLHELIIEESPFDEIELKDGKIQYSAISDMLVEVKATGRFELDDEGRPDISVPKHDLDKATGLFLKGRERQILGKRASKMGVQNVFVEQFDDVDDEQMKHGNRTSVRSYDVIKMARQEYERKQRCGDDFFESVENIIDSQHLDISLNFEETKASRELPGFVRSAQRSPFKIILANYDQLKVAVAYLNNTELSIIYIDSSGKLLKKEKGKSKLLNTAVVIPPPAKGHSPFPIFEMVSEKNKTIDFQTFLEYGFSYLSTANNNGKVCSPAVAVSDFSFANIHSILAVFNKVKIEEYLEKVYRCSLKNEPFPYQTVLSICENHFLPSFLQYARNVHSDKAVADTVVAGILKVVEAESIGAALQVFKTLVDIHCSPEINNKARERVSEAKFEDVKEFISDFGDDAMEEEEMNYGSRKGLRNNSPYFKLFDDILEKKFKENENGNITNRFYAPKLMKEMTRQYLSLFPLFSASVLPDKSLKTNSYIELYWKDQRRILQDIPDRLRWPPRYLGNLHTKIRRDAKSIISHGSISNLKHGGKAKPGMTEAFKAYFEKTKKDVFIPVKQKKSKVKLDQNESFGGTSEMWDSQKSKNSHRRKDNYMKGKNIDYEAIIEHSEIPVEKLTVTGSKMSLANKGGKSHLAEGITLGSEEIKRLLTPNCYIASEIVDSGLILLDKRFNEDSNMKDVLFVYTIQNLRLILGGETNLINEGKFVTVLPRNLGLDAEHDRMETIRAGGVDIAPGSHYTLVSNLNCKDGEVNVYETFEPFRCQQYLLSESGVKIIKMLTQSETLKINCINVQQQHESECGAISIGLAIQLCFYPEDEGAMYYRLNSVRTELFRCLRENQLSYFKYSKVKPGSQGRVLFSRNY